MIGQTDLKNVFCISYLKSNRPLPRSILLIGLMGSGRRTFAKWLMGEMNLPLVEVGNKADDIRELSEWCYKTIEPTYFLIPNVEQMSSAAQNALLKILEEPPNNVGFILTTIQDGLILRTIKSRCITYYMNSYSESELVEYAQTKYELGDEEKSVLQCVCACPGDVDKLFQTDILAFNEYVDRVFNNIAKVSGSNSFKIGEKLSTADDDGKFDLMLFWRAFASKCISEIGKNKETDYQYGQWTLITTRYMQELRVKGANKQMAVDNWIVDIRRVWFNANS